jgi:hypothetical protein
MAGANQLVEMQKTMAGQCGQKLGAVRQIIDREKSEDDALRIQYGQQWKR